MSPGAPPVATPNFSLCPHKTLETRTKSKSRYKTQRRERALPRRDHPAAETDTYRRSASRLRKETQSSSSASYASTSAATAPPTEHTHSTAEGGEDGSRAVREAQGSGGGAAAEHSWALGWSGTGPRGAAPCLPLSQHTPAQGPTRGRLWPADAGGRERGPPGGTFYFSALLCSVSIGEGRRSQPWVRSAHPLETWGARRTAHGSACCPGTRSSWERAGRGLGVSGVEQGC